MKYNLFKPKSQYYRFINQRKFYTVVLLLLLLVSLLGVKGNYLRNSRIQNEIFFIQGTSIGTMVVPNTNLKYPLAYFTPYDDFYIRSDKSTQYIKTPFFGNLLNMDIFNTILIKNKNVTYNSVYVEHKIKINQNRPINIIKSFNISPKEQVEYLSNGIKFTNQALIFDNKGNFYSEKAGLEELEHMDKILNNQNRLFAEDLFFKNAQYVYIYDPNSGYTIKFNNNPVNKVFINPKYRTVSILSDISTNANRAETFLSFEVLK